MDEENVSSFNERQKELCLLSSFLSEQEQWLQSLLQQLKWSQHSPHTSAPPLVQCPYNEHHYVPSRSLELHKAKCVYQTIGVDYQNLGESELLVIDSDSLYQNSGVLEVKIDNGIERAVAICARNPEFSDSKELPHRTSIPQKDTSIEDSQKPSLDVKTLTPQQIISYIKSWQRIPLDWTSTTLSSLDLARVKGWLFNHLPTGHAHSVSVGGEITAVNSIMSHLTLLPGQPVNTTITPNKLVEQLTPLLQLQTREFVLNLWKFIYISQLQAQHSISDNSMDDIAPMPHAQLVMLGGAPVKTEREGAPLLLQKIQGLVQQDTSTISPSTSNEPLPLPMDAVFYTRTPSERRLMYDYVIETTRSNVPKERKSNHDADLYRDDVAALKAKLKAEAQQPQGSSSQSFMDVLKERKEKRDYKRRRQKYRAKNVHITRRKTSEIYRDIINNRMEEIKESILSQETPHPKVRMDQYAVSTVKQENIKDPDTFVRHREASTSYEHQEQKEHLKSRVNPLVEMNKDQEKKDNSKELLRSEKKRKRRRSRSRSRSRSRERVHKKHKKHHKSHSHR